MSKKYSSEYIFLLCLLGGVLVICSALITGINPIDNIVNKYSLLLFIVHFIAFYLSNISYIFIHSTGYIKMFEYSLKYFTIYLCTWLVVLNLFDRDNEYTRDQIFSHVLFSSLFIWLMLLILRKMIDRFVTSHKLASRVIIVTTSDKLEMIAHMFNQAVDSFQGVISAVLLMDKDGVKDMELPEYFSGVQFITLKEFESFVTKQIVDESLIYLDTHYDTLIGEMIIKFEEAGIVSNVHITLSKLPFSLDRRIDFLSGIPVIKFSSKFYDYKSIVLKRVIDICFALVGCVIAMFVGILLVPLIKIDSKGPVIFAQKRVGKNGRIFKFYKFRSMRVDAEEIKEQLLTKNEVNGLMFKMDDDPRITRVGKFIRKTSLDELPQFFNILFGDMSLVGTRPPTLDEYEQYTLKYKKRLALKPGLTGMWQVSGRSEINDFDKVVELDVEYIDNWSLWLDIKIIIKTIKIVFVGKGAK